MDPTESPEDRLLRLRSGAGTGGPPPGFTGTFNGQQYANGQPIASTDANPSAPNPTDPGAFSAPARAPILAGTVSGSNPLGVGATPPSLGAGPASPAVQRATGSAPLSNDQLQALGAAPLTPTAATSVGTNTVNPNSIPRGTTITGVASSPSPLPSGPTPSSLLSQAVSGGPPPHFTGTFNGRQYSDGQPVGGGSTPSSGGAAAPAPTPVYGGARPPTPTSIRPVPTGVTGAAPAPTPIPIPTSNLPQPTSLLDSADTSGPPPPTETGTANTAGQVPDAGSGQLNTLTSDLMGQLNDLQSQVSQGNQPADVMVLFNQQLASILQSINDEEGRLRSEAEKAGTSLDPATEFTLTKMREELDRQLKSNAMALNARGLYDSGILQNAELELRKGNMSDQAGILATRLSKIQEDLTNSLRSLSGRKLDAAESYGKAGLTAQLTENNAARDRQSQAQQALLSARMGLRNQLSGEQQSRASMANSNNQAAIDREFRAKQAQIERDYQTQQTAAKTTVEQEQAARDYQQKLELLQREYDLRLRNDQATAATRSNSGTVNLTRPQGTTSLGQKYLNTFKTTGVNTLPDTATAGVDSFRANVQGFIDDGLSDEDINRLYQAAKQYDDTHAQPGNYDPTKSYGPGY